MSYTNVAVAGGSVTGRHHRRLDRPSQDAWATAQGAGVVVAAVCDGCGSGRRSEVGAVLGAQLWVRAVVDAVAAGASVEDPRLWSAARARVVEAIAGVLAALGGDDDRRALVDHALFTSLVAAMAPGGAAVYAVGDGLVAIDDDVRVLGPFADDQPPYIGYDLVGADPVATLFTACDAQTIALASDGARDLTGDDLAALWRDPRFVRNPDAIRRHLAVLNRETVHVDAERGTVVRGGQPLGDDTTVVVLRRLGDAP
jgi:hypothetical protein